MRLPGPALCSSGVRAQRDRRISTNTDVRICSGRYLPARPGDLHAGGELQMMVIDNSAGTSYSTYSDDTGTEYRTAWVTIPDPDYAPGTTRPAEQGQSEGEYLHGLTTDREIFICVSPRGGIVLCEDGSAGQERLQDMRVARVGPSI